MNGKHDNYGREIAGTGWTACRECGKVSHAGECAPSPAPRFVTDAEAEKPWTTMEDHGEALFVDRLLATRAALLAGIGRWYRNEISADDLFALAAQIRGADAAKAVRGEK